jgi:hypothetical protein
MPKSTMVNLDLKSEPSKIILSGAFILILAYVWGYVINMIQAGEDCPNPYDFDTLPMGGQGLKTGGTGTAGGYTVNDAKKMADAAYNMYETYNPFTKTGEDALAAKLLNLNDDQFSLVCRQYQATYSSKLYEDIKDDYWGITGWVDDLLDTNTGRVIKRLERLNLN